jgi:hypothetical protein
MNVKQIGWNWENVLIKDTISDCQKYMNTIMHIKQSLRLRGLVYVVGIRKRRKSLGEMLGL